MLIVCPTCATSYDVDTASLRPNGRQVRCVRCRTVWRAELSHADKLIAAAEALAPVRRAVEAMSNTMAEAAAAPDAASDEPAGPKPGRDDIDWAEAAPVATDEESLAAAIPESVSPDSRADDVVEVKAPSIAPVDLDADRTTIEAVASSAPEAAPEEEPSDDIETIAARRYRAAARRKKRGWPLTLLQSAILVLLVVNGVIIGWRKDFVRALPQTASFYAAIGMPVYLRGVDFDGLTTATEQHENVPILVVERKPHQSHRPHHRFATAEIRGAQCRARGNLFLDRGAAAAVAAVGRSGLVPHQARFTAAGRA